MLGCIEKDRNHHKNDFTIHVQDTSTIVRANIGSHTPKASFK